jgi:hypothetical protein
LKRYSQPDLPAASNAGSQAPSGDHESPKSEKTNAGGTVIGVVALVVVLAAPARGPLNKYFPDTEEKTSEGEKDD